ncbi:MAG: tRNA uridine-5-carboxymethylaminomethyl(34) synthesis GTPase MnmE [Kiritimatiellae bacterium]|nr:tRNA uridine-5-carboxymethylaminomethyl(34) synthesis GTPase MnmE [Kiritimatiellia bacterium]
MSFREDTIAAVATPLGRGGVAVVRVSGPKAFEIASNLSTKAPKVGRIVFARFIEGDKILDEGLLLSFKAPASFTGEDVVEFQCHGGTVAPQRILDATIHLGARLARRGEFTERAFLNGKMSFDQAEALLDFIDAKTERAADAALGELVLEESSQSNIKNVIRKFYDETIAISTELEYSLDVDESDLGDEFFNRLEEKSSNLIKAIDLEASRLKERRILREGALVVLLGPPNAGKSSLLNAILSEARAIVSDIAGTTRDSIEAWADIAGWPVKLVDTAGIRKSGENFSEIEAEGVRRSEELAKKADVVIAFGDFADECGINLEASKVIKITPKCDLKRGDALNVSALTHEGVEELKLEVAARLKLLASKSDDNQSLEGERYLTSLLRARGVLAAVDFKMCDAVLIGNEMRRASQILGEAVGANYSDDILSGLFSRFCVGK